MGGFKESLKDALWSLKRNRKTQGVLLGFLLVVSAVLGGFLIFQPDTSAPTPATNVSVNAPREVVDQQKYRAIDGAMVSSRENVLPSLVMIENIASVRPQYGLSKANLVIEALAEGGITRFLAVYADGSDVKQMGPVRSGRAYFLEWMAGLGGIAVHAGGSPQALSIAQELDNIVDLDHLHGGAPYFWRDARFLAPHNLFTSSELLARAIRDKKASNQGDFESWTYKDDAPLADRPDDSKKISIDFSTFSYFVEYEYNREKNDYLRKNGGEVQKDKLNDSEIRAKNVVVQFVRTSLLNDAESGRLKMDVTGEGAAIVFRDGEILNATWKKPKRNQRTQFFDENNAPIEFNRGTTWIEVVPTDRRVEYN